MAYGTSVLFEWDDAKEALNVGRHGVDFALAAQAALDPHRVELFDLDHSDREDRWTVIGMASSIPIVLRVTVTERDDGETVRIISARKANESERRIYADQQGAPP
jgi:hypothetical protein